MRYWIAPVLVAIAVTACGGDPSGEASTPAPAAAPATVPDSTIADPTAGPGSTVQSGDSMTIDFGTLPSSDSGASQVASMSALATVAKKLPAGPTQPRGLSATAIYAFADGIGDRQVYIGSPYGNFWFEEQAGGQTPADMPDRCNACSASESGRTTLANGDPAVVWRATEGPSSITWWHGGVRHAILGPSSTLTREVLLKLAGAFSATA